MRVQVVREVAQEIGYLSKGLGKTLLYLYFPVMALLTLLHFPSDTDPSLRRGGRAATAAAPAATPAKQRLADFYEVAYQANGTQKRAVITSA